MSQWTILVQGIVSSDAAAEHALALQMLPAIRVMIRRRGVRSWSDIDDLAQEAFAELLVALRGGKLREQDKLPQYVAKLVKHLCVDQYRQKLKLVSVQAELVLQPDELPAARAERRQLWSQVLHAIRALTVPRDREILIAFYVDGEDKEQICARFGLTAALFDSLIHRARDRVRENLPSPGRYSAPRSQD